MKYWQVVEKMSEDERDALPMNLKLEAIDSFLNSTVWKTFRRETIENECCLCDRRSNDIYFDSEREKQTHLDFNDKDFYIKGSLHLHHIKPMLKYFKYGFKSALLPYNFLTVCYECHNWVHLREDAREKEMLMFKDLLDLSLYGEFVEEGLSYILKLEKKILTPKGKPKKGFDLKYTKTEYKEGWWLYETKRSGREKRTFLGIMR